MIERLETLTSGELPAANELRSLTEDVRVLYEDVARYLDDDQVEQFPNFFIDDCSYQVVSRENFAEGLPQATIYCDGIAMVRDRVIALRQTQVYVPRTWRHFISGVRVMAVAWTKEKVGKASGDVVGERHHLIGGAEDELPRMQDERLIALGLDHAGEVRLLLARVDVGVLVVLEDPEPAVQAHVDARRLDHRLGVGLEGNAARGNLGLDIAIR